MWVFCYIRDGWVVLWCGDGCWLPCSNGGQAVPVYNEGDAIVAWVDSVLVGLCFGGGGLDTTREHRKCNVLSKVIKVFYGLLLYTFGFTINVTAGSISIATSTMGGLSSTDSGVVAVINAGLSGGPVSSRRPFNRNEVRCVDTLVVSFFVFLVDFRLNGANVRGVLRPRSIGFDAVSLVVLVTTVNIGL